MKKTKNNFIDLKSSYYKLCICKAKIFKKKVFISFAQLKSPFEIVYSKHVMSKFVEKMIK